MTKDHIIQKMMGDGTYADFVPDKTWPKLLSRDFLLSVYKKTYNFLVNNLCKSSALYKSSKFWKAEIITNQLQ